MSATFVICVGDFNWHFMVSWFVTVCVRDFHDLCPRLSLWGSFSESWRNGIWALAALLVLVYLGPACHTVVAEIQSIYLIQHQAINWWHGYCNVQLHDRVFRLSAGFCLTVITVITWPSYMAAKNIWKKVLLCIICTTNFRTSLWAK